MTDNTNGGVRRPRVKRPEMVAGDQGTGESTDALESTDAVESNDSVDTVDTVDTTPTGKLKSVENTVKKMKYIKALLAENGDMSLNMLMEAVYKKFGTRIAFNKAKIAKNAYDLDLPIEARDGRRDRTGSRLSINRHENMAVIVAIIEDDQITDSHLCDGDEEAMQTAMRLVSNGVERDSIQIFQRCHIEARIKW